MRTSTFFLTIGFILMGIAGFSYTISSDKFPSIVTGIVAVVFIVLGLWIRNGPDKKDNDGDDDDSGWDILETILSNANSIAGNFDGNSIANDF